MEKPDPKLDLTTLKNILRLEEKRGFDNKAVAGGLDLFIEHWRGDLISAFPRSPIAKRLLAQLYSSLTPRTRQEWARQWLEHFPNKPVKPTSKRTKSQQTSAKTKESSSRTSSPEETPISSLRRVDIKTAQKLARLDVESVKDLLYLFPRRHLDYTRRAKISELIPGEHFTLEVTVWEARVVSLGKSGRLKATEALVGDETGNIKVIWFGQSYLARQFPTGSKIILSGKLDFFNRDRLMESPNYEIISHSSPLIHTGRLVPVYPLTEGLTARNMRRIVWQAVDGWSSSIKEFLPKTLLKRTRLNPLTKSIRQAHFPDNPHSFEQARRRLAFNELLLLQLAVHMQRKDWQQSGTAIAINDKNQLVSMFLKRLPFDLTPAQQRCVGEILTDMKTRTIPMSRLLQGEVGSGKTVVALAALLASVSDGYQGTIMVPTEILAEQHFATSIKLLSDAPKLEHQDNLIKTKISPHSSPISIGLITGSTKKSTRKKLQDLANSGSLDIIIGTQSLIQDTINVPNLALAIVDEQQRFGVMQRSELRAKGMTTPHLLVMSATPIPRTLALTLFGDLDISTIDELPPGRQEVLTKWVPHGKRDAAHGFIRDQINSGRQAFIIFPLVEESETIESGAAIEGFEHLKAEIFPDLCLGLLHGRMKAKEKEAVMNLFQQGKIDILISTPVVEVGIDIPNATVMLIETADRFGLSQLHQFRGRVGRGIHKSYCLLLSDNPSTNARERLAAMETIHDGFKLAEVDLGLRGPGDLFGTRQSGLPNLRLARLTDQDLLVLAREEASNILAKDPALTNETNFLLAKEVFRFKGDLTGAVG